MNIQDSIRLIEASHKTWPDCVHDFSIGLIVLAAITLSDLVRHFEHGETFPSTGRQHD